MIQKLMLLILNCFVYFSIYAQDSGFKQLNATEFAKIIRSEPGTLLDVRTLGEFKNAHLRDAGQLNYYALDFKQKLLLLPKEAPIYLYCNTGYRSEKAAEILAANGYPNVYNLEHGILEWNLNNLPVLTEPDARPDNENKMEPGEFAALKASEKLVLVDFYAPWCAPCRKMMPMIDSLKVDYQQRVNIVKVNVDASKKLMKELKITSVPFLVLNQSGKQLSTHNGTISRQELTKLLDSHLPKK